MKNQYFGDRRDLFKYDLLADLAGCLPDQRLVFIPMLTPNDDSGEGSLTGYSRGERRGPLVDALRNAVASGNRNIQILRDLMPSVGVQFMPYQDADYFQDATRAEYFAAVPTEWLAESVVFFDPDIGLETGTATYMRGSGVEKYLLYADLSAVWARASDDSVFVMYQHLQNDATKRTADVQRRLRDLTTHLASASAWAVQWGDVAFLVAVREGSVAARVGRTLDEHVQRHGGMLSQDERRHGGFTMAELCKHGMDRRFCSLCSRAPDSPKPSRPPNSHLAPWYDNTDAETVRLDDIVAYLNAVQIRATYGAVAQVVGGIAQSIGERLGGVAGRRPEASWVVNSETGMPTGYLPEHRHPALLSSTDIIGNGYELRRRLAEWKAAAAPKSRQNT